MGHRIRIATCAILIWMLGVSAQGFATDPPAGRLTLLGDGLTVSPARQTVPPDTPTIIQTQFTGGAGWSQAQDLVVRGDWTGPGSATPVTLSTFPGEPFRIPGLAAKGQYVLANIRLESGGQVLARARPDRAEVQVTDILIANVTTTPLTLDQLQAMGVVITDANFSAYSFSFALVLESGVVSFNVPVIYSGGEIAEPQVINEQIAVSGQAAVPPFRLKPFSFRIPQLEMQKLPEPDVDYDPDPPPIRGLMLIPSDIGFLHQFFSMVIAVTNGAPENDPLVLKGVQAKLFLDSHLRRAQTDPPQDLSAPVPVIDPGPDGRRGTNDDSADLFGQHMGKAEVVVEGLAEGTWPARVELEGVLEGMPVGPVNVSGELRTAVVVRDPDFSVTLTHPDTVRSGEEYDLGITVLNTGTVPANLLSFTLPAWRLSGARLLSEETVSTEALLPGDSLAATFRLVATRTGKVTATSIKAVDGVRGRFQFTVGVGDNNIPLSPETLRLPAIVGQTFDADLYNALLGLLGEAHGLANAPPGYLPAGFQPVSAGHVQRLAVWIIEAAQAVRFGEPAAEAEAALYWKVLGLGPRDPGFEILRRKSRHAAVLNRRIAGQGLDPASGCAAALEGFWHAAGDAPVVMGALEGAGWRAEIVDADGRTTGVNGAGILAQSVPHADALLGVADRAALLWAQPNPAGTLRFLPGDSAGPAQVWVTQWASGVFRLLHYELAAPIAGAWLEWDGFQLRWRGAATTVVAPTASTVMAPGALRILGARLDAGAYGGARVILVRFNKPPVRESAQANSTWIVPGSTIVSVSPQSDARVFALVTERPLDPFSPVEARPMLSVTGLAGADGVAWDGVPVRVDPAGVFHGGRIRGRVVSAEGAPQPGIQVLRYEPRRDINEDVAWTAVERAVTDESGAYAFRFVPSRVAGFDPAAFVVKAWDPDLHQKKTASGLIHTDGEERVLDFALFGFGTVRGAVHDLAGQPVPGAWVLLRNLTVPEGQTQWAAQTDEAGQFAREGVPVGTWQLTAFDAAGRRGSAGTELPRAGASVQVNLTLVSSPMGTAEVTILDGHLAPLPGAWAVVARVVGGTRETLGWQRTDAAGKAIVANLPAGPALYLTVYDPAGRRGPRELQFVVGPGTTTALTYVFPDQELLFASVTGTVRDGVGTVIPGAWVVDVGSGIQQHADGQGRYRLEGIPVSGRRTLWVADEARGVAERFPFEVNVGGQEVALDVRLGAYGTIVGTAFRSDGITPAPGATLWLKHAANEGSARNSVTAGADGRFRFDAIPVGSWVVQVVTASGQAGWAPVNVAYANQMVSATVRAFRIDGEISVTAVTAATPPTNTEQPVIGQVLLYPAAFDGARFYGEEEPIRLTTDNHGNVIFRGLLEGTHRGEMDHPVLGKKGFQVTLGPGAMQVSRSLVFTPALTVKGTVLRPDGLPSPNAKVTLHAGGFTPVDVVCDAAGRFQFDQAPRGGLVLEAEEVSGTHPSRGQVRVAAGFGGTELVADIALLRVGSLHGHVIRKESDGTLIPVGSANLSLMHHGYPTDAATAQSEPNGSFAFPDLWEGVSTLRAMDPATGTYSTADVAFDAAAPDAVRDVVLEPYNPVTLAGLVSDASGNPAGFAEIHLQGAGEDAGYGLADEAGQYSIPGLKPALYTADLIHPATGQTRRESVDLRAKSGIVARNFRLDGSGTVSGLVTDGGTDALVPGAQVKASGSGTTLVTQSDEAGAFRIGGIPVGSVTVKASAEGGLRSGSTAGTLAWHGQVLDMPVALDPVGTVEGIVTRRDGATPVAGAVVSWSAPGKSGSVTADPTGRFEIRYVPDGQVKLTARDPLSADLGTATGTLAPAGTLELPVSLRGLGKARIHVHYSDGDPATGASVKLKTAAGVLVATLSGDSNGVYPTPEILLGGYVVTAAAGSLKGMAAFTLDSVSPAVMDVDVALAASGEVLGSLSLEDGSPAASMRIRAQRSATTITIYTGEDGAFRFENLPAGGASWRVSAGEGDARGRVQADVDVIADQSLDLGVLRLDPVPPVVVQVDPADGSASIPRSGSFTLWFSEPVSPATIGSVTLRGPSGSIAVNRVLDGSGTQLQVTPGATLPNHAALTLTAGSSVTDLAGNPLVASVFGFVTEDTIGPKVILRSPSANAINQSSGTQPTLTFDEPVSVPSATLVLKVNGAPAAFDARWNAAFDAVTLDPSSVSGLPDNSIVEWGVQAVTDPSGNPIAAPSLSTFATTDTVAPVYTVAVPAGAVEGTLMTVTPVAGYSNDLVRVLVQDSLGRTLADRKSNFGSAINVTVPRLSALAGAPYTITASAFDLAGNASAPDAHRIEVTPDQAPSAQAGTPPGFIVRDVATNLALTASDDVGLSRIRVHFGGVYTGTVDKTVSGTGGAFTVNVTIPPTAPEGSLTWRFEVTDTAGQSVLTSEASTQLVAASGPLALVDSSPANGAVQVDPPTVILLYFNRSVRRDTATDASVVLRMNGNPAPRSLAFSDGADVDSVITVVPGPGVPRNNAFFEVALSTALKDAGGVALAAPVVVSFHTKDTEAPIVVGLTPLGNSKNQSPDVQAQVTYSEPCAVTDPSAFSWLNLDTGALVPFTISVQPDGLSYRLIPTPAVVGEPPLNFGTRYRVVASNLGVTDPFGNAGTGSSSRTSDFTTVSVPAFDAGAGMALRTGTGAGSGPVAAVSPKGALPFSNTFSVCAWIRKDGTSGFSGAVSHSQSDSTGSNTLDFGFVADGTSTNLFWALYNTSGASLALPYAIPDTGKWHFYVGTYDGQTSRFYIDGILVNSGSYSAPAAPRNRATGELAIGLRWQTTGRTYWNGAVDEVRIYDRALSQEEIRASMCAKVKADAPGLIGAWHLDEGDGFVARDATATMTHLVLNAKYTDTWEVSRAPLGDLSVSSWNGQAISLTGSKGAAMSLASFGGAPASVHLYHVDHVPSPSTAPAGTGVLDPYGYWGVHFVGGNSPSAVATLHVDVHPGADLWPGLSLATRNAAGQSWLGSAVVLDRSAGAFTWAQSGSGQVIMASNQPFPSEVSFSTSQIIVSEDAGTVTIPVIRRGTPATTLDVPLALATDGASSADFGIVPPAVSFPAGGPTAVSISVPVTADDGIEDDESISLTLDPEPSESALGSHGSIEVKIVDEGVHRPGAGYALHLDGAEDVATTSPNTAVPVSGGLTVAAWVHVTGNGRGSTPYFVYQGVRGADAASLSRLNWALSLDSTGTRFRFVALTSSGALISAVSSQTIGSGWYHVRGEISASKITLYVDNKIAAEASFTGAIMYSPEAGISVGGREFSQDGAWLRGDVDEVRIYSRTLSQDEAGRTWNLPLIGDEPGLEAYWRMDEGGGDVLSDASGHGRHLTIDSRNPYLWMTSGADLSGGQASAARESAPSGDVAGELVGVGQRHASAAPAPGATGWEAP